MTTAKQETLANGTVRVTLSSYSATCIPSIFYRLDGGTSKGMSSNPGSFVIAKPGSTTVTYWAVDLSGNREDSRTLKVVVNAEDAVTITSASGVPSSAREGQGVAFSATASDSRGHAISYEWKLGSATLSTARTFSTSTLAVGTHVITVTASCAGGKTASSSVTVNVEAVPPSVTLTASSPVLTYPSVVTLTAVARKVDATTAVFQSRRADKEDLPENWVDLKTVSSSTGQFVYIDFPGIGYHYRVKAGGLVSEPVFVAMRTLLSRPSASTTKARLGTTVKLAGTIRPFHSPGTPPIGVNYRVYVERYDFTARKWRSVFASGYASAQIAAAVDNDTSRWEQLYKTSRLGQYRARFYHQCPRHRATFSPTRYFSVIR